MSKRDVSLNRARCDIDTKRCEKFTIYDFPAHDRSRLRAAIKHLVVEGELEASREGKTKLVTFKATRFPLTTVGTCPKKPVKFEAEFAYKYWFTIPNFKVKSVYRHVGE